jgi:uncharacterized protein involved in cysteine biosynthesis
MQPVDRAALTFLTPLTRALGQFDDPVFIGVVWRTVAWSVACLIALHGGAIWLVHRFLQPNGMWAWLADFASGFGVSLLSLWLFLPVAATIGMMYFDRIARAVERRHYPWLPPPAGEAVAVQIWDSAMVGLKVLGLNILALLLALTGIGLIPGWLIAGYAIGRGLFVATAMRRMPRPMAEHVYRANRWTVLAQGAALALASYVPVLNLLLPVIGTAAMVHLLDISLSATPVPPSFRNMADS